jgi:hypothetical protein
MNLAQNPTECSCATPPPGHDYRVLDNERGGGPLDALPAAALAGYALGAGLGDPVEELLKEIAVRLRVLRAALQVDDGFMGDTDFDEELYMLSRRAEAAHALLRHRDLAKHAKTSPAPVTGAKALETVLGEKDLWPKSLPARVTERIAATLRAEALTTEGRTWPASVWRQSITKALGLSDVASRAEPFDAAAEE